MPRVYEDRIYRFYHQSFKVCFIQDETRRIVEALRSVAPHGGSVNPWFDEIYRAGAGGKKFEMEHNNEWTAHTRAFLEAIFHAEFFLEMAVKYGQKLKEPPEILPSGWAALLYFYNITDKDRAVSRGNKGKSRSGYEFTNVLSGRVGSVSRARRMWRRK